MTHDDDSFDSSLGSLLSRALQQRVDPETRRRHLDALTTQAVRLRDDAPVAEVIPLRPRYQRFGMVAAGLALVLFSGTAVLDASQEALPGDLLYTVKRGTETARLLLAVSPEAQAEVRAEIAATRSEEMQQLAAQVGRPAVARIQALAEEAHDQLAAAAAVDPDGDAVAEAEQRVQEDTEGTDQIIGGVLPTESPAPLPSPVPTTPPVTSLPPETTTVPVPSEEPTPVPPVTAPGSSGGGIAPNEQTP